ncbi:MAG TPA: peptidoglycan-binding domain-containing protein [Polyangiaceae bacterium]|nr:peptidoglycan-binding domain-containing protein [Polyangiaceae bacterium]
MQKAYGKTVAVVDLSSLTPDQSRALQRQLASAGYYHGKVDGIIGPGTRQALGKMLERQFTLNQRLLRQGKLTEPFVAGIGVQASELAPVSGIDPRGSQMATPREFGPEPPADPASDRKSSVGASDAQSDEPGTEGTGNEPGPSREPRAE